jgi:hypothetical protein
MPDPCQNCRFGRENRRGSHYIHFFAARPLEKGISACFYVRRSYSLLLDMPRRLCIMAAVCNNLEKVGFFWGKK